MKIILKLIYLLLSWNINLKFAYNNEYEYLVGTIVTTSIINLIDKSIIQMAFWFTGKFMSSIKQYNQKMEIIHWSVRIILCLIVWMISISPQCCKSISPFIQNLTEWLINYVKHIISELSNDILTQFATSN